MRPAILTNMTFWQSPEWTARVDSLYRLDSPGDPPQPLPWWREAWQLYRRRRDYDVIHTMGIRESFAYAFLCWITGQPSRQIMTEVFIDDPRPDRLAWRLKTALYRRLARRAMGMIVNSSAEVDSVSQRLAMPRESIRFVPLNSTIEDPRHEPRPAGYLFCAGRTLRDYAVLRDVMLAREEPWQVVAGTRDLLDAALPARITIHREIDRAAYLELLRGARIVVLPLLPTVRSTGQVVLLEAMSLGKPVITTRVPGTVDIIRHGVNGWLVAPGDAKELIGLVDHLLASADECARAGQQALADIRNIHTTALHAQHRLAAITELWNGAQAHAGRVDRTSR